jgi:tetratricopeptide (TPR) repeat protein
MNRTTPANAPVPRRRPQLVEAKDPARSSALWRWAAAAPAILALASSAIMGAVIFTQSPGEVLQWYQTVAEKAMTDHDYQLAVVCYQRLIADEPENPANEFGFALSLAAIEMLARLTPDNGPGYVPARLFLAEKLLDSKSPTSEALARAEQNLLRVIEAEPMNETAHAHLAEIYAGEGKWELFKYHLERSGVFRQGLEGRFVSKMPGETGLPH